MSRDKLNTLYLQLQKTRGHQTRQGAHWSERLSSLKAHDFLITWPTWGHLTIWKKNIFQLPENLWAVNVAWCLRLGGGGLALKRLSHHRLLVILFSFSFSLSFLDRVVKIFEETSISCSCGHMWPRSGFFHWTHQQITVYTSRNFVCVSLACHVI